MGPTDYCGNCDLKISLIGGGWDETHADRVYGSFAKEVAGAGGRLKFILQHGTPGGRFIELFRSMSIDDIDRVTIRRGATLDAGFLAGCDALFVCGGVNPVYAHALSPVADQIRERVARGMPYAGFSAGAVVAARSALVGGWKREMEAGHKPVCQERRSEGLELLTVERGIGLVPFAVDVHATQWGTLSRATHAVHAGLLDDCVMIDENTVLNITGAKAEVLGANHVYRVLRLDDGVVQVQMFSDGDIVTNTNIDN